MYDIIYNFAWTCKMTLEYMLDWEGLVMVQVVLVAVPVVAAHPCTVRSVYTAAGGGS